MRLVTFPHIVLLTTCNNNLAQVCGVFEREIRRMQFLTPTFWRLARGLFCHRLLNLVQNPSPPTRRRFSEHVAASLTRGRNHQCIFNPVASTAKQLTRPIFSRLAGDSWHTWRHPLEPHSLWRFIHLCAASASQVGDLLTAKDVAHRICNIENGIFFPHVLIASDRQIR